MPRRRNGERILGPYANRSGWIVFEIAANGDRASVFFKTEADAREYVAEFERELKRDDHTTETAWQEYERHLTAQGNKTPSIVATRAAVRSFFPAPLPLHLLTARRCQKLYSELCARPSERTGKPLAADTHRNRLAEVKTFLRWCGERGWIGRNPAESVKGTGKRRPRGKSLGKDGHELRVKEARAWYGKALELAQLGDEGATGALVAMLLGMRASEIVSRTVRDLDEDEEPGDLLWIPDSKTPAGRRQLEVPDVLRPLLVALAEGKKADRYLFEAKPGQSHWRDWIRHNVRRICELVDVPKVTAHAMRGLLATLTTSRGMAGHLVAATLGHESERTTMHAYAAPGSAAAGASKRGLKLLKGGK
jgi:integrase